MSVLEHETIGDPTHSIFQTFLSCVLLISHSGNLIWVLINEQVHYVLSNLSSSYPPLPVIFVYTDNK